MTREAQRPKSVADQVLELLESLQVLRDAVNAMAAGQRHPVLPLAGQLRALLLERRRDAHALLVDLATTLGLSPSLYVMEGADTPLPSNLPTPSFRMAGLPFTLEQQLPNQTNLALGSLSERCLLDFEGRQFTVREIIEFFANRAGGVHFGKAYPETLVRMFSLGVPGQFGTREVLLNAMKQIGVIVYQIGIDCVRRLSDLHVLLDVAVPNPQCGATLLDARYPDSPARLWLHLSDDLHLVATIIGMDGSGLQARVERLLDWSEAHLLRVSLAHDDQLRACMQIRADDGSVIGQAIGNGPLFLPNAWRDYDVAVNRAVDGGAGSASIALAQVMVFSHTTEVDLAKAVSHLAQGRANPHRKAVLYTPGSSGFAASGSGDLANTDGVVMSPMSATLRGE